MKKSIVLLAVAALSVAAPLASTASAAGRLPNGVTYTGARQRVTDYRNALANLTTQEGLMPGFQTTADNAAKDVTDKAIDLNIKQIIVNAYYRATTEAEKTAIKTQYGVDFDTALQNEETANTAYETAVKAKTEADERLATETAKLEALKREVKRTQDLLTPTEKKAIEEGKDPVAEAEKAAEEEKKAEDKKAEDKKAEDKKEAKDVKAANTATGNKALPKTSAAK